MWTATASRSGFAGPSPRRLPSSCARFATRSAPRSRPGTMTLTPEIESRDSASIPGDAAEPMALINHALVSFAKPGADRSAAQAPGQSATIARERFTLEQDLRHAIAREQLEMVFQPVVDVSKGAGRRRGAASLASSGDRDDLARPIHPDFGGCRSDRRDRALDAERRLPRGAALAASEASSGLKVAVNLSAAQLRDSESQADDPADPGAAPPRPAGAGARADRNRRHRGCGADLRLVRRAARARRQPRHRRFRQRLFEPQLFEEPAVRQAEDRPRVRRRRRPAQRTARRFAEA